MYNLRVLKCPMVDNADKVLRRCCVPSSLSRTKVRFLTFNIRMHLICLYLCTNRNFSRVFVNYLNINEQLKLLLTANKESWFRCLWVYGSHAEWSRKFFLHEITMDGCNTVYWKLLYSIMRADLIVARLYCLIMKDINAVVCGFITCIMLNFYSVQRIVWLP